MLLKSQTINRTIKEPRGMFGVLAIWESARSCFLLGLACLAIGKIGRRLIPSPAECAKRYYRSEKNILMYLMDFITIDDRNLLRRFEVRGYPTSFNIPKHNPLSVRVQGIMVVYVSICQNIINNLHGRGNSRHFFLIECCLNRRL